MTPERTMTALIIALVAASVWAGGSTVLLLKKDNSDEVVEAVTANTAAALAPVTLELENIRGTLDEDRLDRHCTKPDGQVDAEYLWCLAADCWQQQAAQGQNASETCGKIRDLADALTRCELQTDEASRLACLSKLTPK